MKTALITGSSGLVGSECVRHFDKLGWRVYGLDNNARADFFGVDGDTTGNLERLLSETGLRHCRVDIRDRAAVAREVKDARPDLVIHAAAQPSHDLAASRPFDDFETNANGTLNLLEAARQYCPDAPFCFLSTNKVYGDVVNEWPRVELPTRHDWMPLAPYVVTKNGADEYTYLDQCIHSLFGCSKLAADVLVQEYGRNFGLPTVCFRAGCLTGGAHAGAEQHGFLAYLAKCCREGRRYVIYGHEGKQVRDNLHAFDVARACEEYAKAPRPGEVYNLGGGRANSVSVLEAIALIEQAMGKRLDWEYRAEPRKGDHACWITDTSKFRSHYPAWDVTLSLQDIIAELCECTSERSASTCPSAAPCR